MRACLADASALVQGEDVYRSLAASAQPMRFLLDESADARLLAYLRDAGHDATSVISALGPGVSDLDVLAAP